MWLSLYKEVDGPKLRKTAKALGTCKADALGILCFLWFWSMDNADSTGKALEADRRDIEIALTSALEVLSEERVEPLPVGKVVDVLFETGWIDYRDGYIFIHDWDTWQEAWYKYQSRKEADAERKREARAKLKKATAEAASSKGGSAASEDGPQLQPQTVSEQLAISGEPEPKPAKPRKNYEESFEKWWSEYPRPVDKGSAYKKYKARLNDGASEDDLLRAAKNYAYQCKKRHTEEQYIKQPKTFLGETLVYREYLPETREPAKSRSNSPEKTTNPFTEFREDGQ